METSSNRKELYKSPSGIFTLDCVDGVRDYTERNYIDESMAKEINGADKIIRVTAVNYWYKTTDLGLMIKYLLTNKVMVSAREAEAQKLYKSIRECFTQELF